MRLAIGGCLDSLIWVLTFISCGERFVRMEHLPILFARQVADQSAHHRACGLIAFTEFDERPAEDHLAARVAFALSLRLACLGGVKPSFGLLVLSFRFFHLCFRHRAPLSPSICLPSQHRADFLRR